MSEADRLTAALQAALKDPEARTAFYEILMKSEVHAPGVQDPGNGSGPPRPRFRQLPQPEGFAVIPFFSSPEALKKTLGENEPYLTLPAQILFRMTRGATLALTTAGQGDKLFRPDEVETLLSSVWALDPLAAALEKAVRENTDQAKLEFYNVLINSRALVFGQPKNQETPPAEGGGDAPTQEAPPQKAGARPLGPKENFSVATMPHPHLEGQRVLPFFSSDDFLRQAAQRANLRNPPYLGFNALDLFKLAKDMGLPLVLNPGPSVYKIFALGEIDFILSQAREDPFEPRRFKPGGKIFLGPPEVYPQALAEALADFLPSLPAVKAAYLTALREEGSETVLTIGFETEAGADLAALLRQAAPIASAHAQPGQALDFASVSPGEKGLSQFFLEKVEPFYRRPLRREGEGAGPAPAAAAPPLGADSQQYESAGFFGRLRRIFKA